MKEYDESAAIKFIRTQLDGTINNSYSGDDLLLVIDAIFDYFEQYSEDDDFEFSEHNLNHYVKNQLRKDVDNVIELDDVPAIVAAELKYEDTLEDDED